MRKEVDSRTGASRFVVFTGLEGWTPNEVYVIGNVSGGEPVPLTPEQARGMGEALLRAADEAESGTSEEARLRTELAAINDALQDAGIDYPLGARGVRDLAAQRDLAREDD